MYPLIRIPQNVFRFSRSVNQAALNCHDYPSQLAHSPMSRCVRLYIFVYHKAKKHHSYFKTIVMKFNPYLNFDGNAEEAFRFYQSVFGGELFVQRMGDTPGSENLPDDEKNRAMHVSIPVGEGQTLMASDCVPSAGHVLNVGNNNYISVTPDSREEADRLFNGLSAEGNIEVPMGDQFWGDYFGSFVDKFGVHWMINFPSNSK